jgi:hypothetical protein
MNVHEAYEMTEQNLSWEDIFLCYPIFDNICSHLDPVDILFLRLTIKKLSSCFESLFKTQWNINRQLTRFVKDPVSLRSLLAKHDALMSGAFAVQFFKRAMWDDDDDNFGLDIFVDTLSPFRKSDPLDEYLMGREGYELQSAKAWSSDLIDRFAGLTAPISEVFRHICLASRSNLLLIESRLKSIIGGPPPKRKQLRSESSTRLVLL